MKKCSSINELMGILKKEKIQTWFDLGLFIDRFKENKPIPTAEFSGTFKDFKTNINNRGVAFITYQYSVDGVSIEVEKYAKSFCNLFHRIPIYYIAGKFYPESSKLIDPKYIQFEIPEACGFDMWELYQDFFFTKLQRGSKEYNELIIKFWDQTLLLIEKLGKFIEERNIGLLYIINVCSNPGNVSLSLALVLISEFLRVPVINNNHDFYWEGGNRQVDIKNKELKKGPRDFFFTNSDIGEFFSQIEVLYPWESRSWISVNINKGQSEHIIERNGHNPANVTEIGTAVDTNEYMNISKRQKINTFYQFEQILSRYNKTLIGYSVDDVLNSNLVDKDNPKPILVGLKTKSIEHFLIENVIFLQPTRIIARKRIELGFKLIRKMFHNSSFIEKFRKTQDLKLTFLVTGPVASGHYEYFRKLLKRFSQLLNIINPDIRHKIYLAFLFCELDKESFKRRFENPVGIPELYNIASLILLPSKTEGRGLPIIEASACGTPIFCRRYYPENVYSEVIGESLPEEDRLKVIEFDGKKVTSKHVDTIVRRVFFPHQYMMEINHNKQAVQKRYSLEALDQNILDICYKLYMQLRSNKNLLVKTRNSFKEYSQMVFFKNKDTEQLIKSKNRHYLPGYGRLKFMLYLKSLIDPSFFRAEQQEVKGLAFIFARNIVRSNPIYDEIPVEKIHDFYNAVDNIFNYRKGNDNIRHDHSMSYRHRNRYYYPYQDFTIHELTGLINMLYFNIIKPKAVHQFNENLHFFVDWNLALAQLTSSSFLAIDDRKILIKKMKANVPIGLFPGDYLKYELEFFALQSVRSRLKLKIHEELTEELLVKCAKKVAPIYVFTQEQAFGKRLNNEGIEKFIIEGRDNELKLLYKNKIVRLIKTNQLCLGIHIPQLGIKPLKVLREIQACGGYIISNRQSATVMTDFLDIDRFHIGKVIHPVTANMMGIPEESGYIQHVPRGLRTTIAYPTPIQTAKDFSTVFKSRLYNDLCNEHGEERVLEILREDAELRGSPIKHVLEKLSREKEEESNKYVEFSYISGVYDDGMPYNGVIARAYTGEKKINWKFVIKHSRLKTKKVTTFVNEFKTNQGKKPQIAWNGGYILNPELVGKLGLPEKYIGTPLGLLISDSKLLSPPLFNKPAFIIYKDGSIDIKKVNVKKGIVVSSSKSSLRFSTSGYNASKPDDNFCYYDLMYEKNIILGDGRIIVRLAGNVIKEIIRTKKGQNVQIIPVGLTLSISADSFPKDWNNIGKELTIKVYGIKDILHAVEAGPMLINNGRKCIDMENEGWKSQYSIRTQAARIDYVDMRGPKIAAGIDNEGNLIIVTVNGRIRESVGATHEDMANILKSNDIYKAMGFDPGGSSTLVVDGKTLNISPYNSNYESNIYALPPEPRAVSNAIIGYTED